MDDPTPEQFKRALSFANTDIQLGLTDDDICNLGDYVAALCRVVVAEERRTGRPLEDDLIRALLKKREAALAAIDAVDDGGGDRYGNGRHRSSF